MKKLRRTTRLKALIIPGQDQGLVGVDQPELPDQQVVGDQAGAEEEGQQDQPQDDAPPGTPGREGRRPASTVITMSTSVPTSVTPMLTRSARATIPPPRTAR